jgi:hypothetical protein
VSTLTIGSGPRRPGHHTAAETTKTTQLELDPWIHRVDQHLGFELEYDEDRVWARSDHYNFAARGIPVAFVFSGFHADCQQASDTPEKIDWDKLTRVARLTYLLAFEVAGRAPRLRVNRP